MLRVLLVAPESDLEYAQSEVQDILRSGLIVTPLLGKVRQQDLVREAEQAYFDVLWLVTHGSLAGIELSDGLLPASALSAIVRGRFRAVILNTCESVGAAQMLQSETGADIICTIAPVDDAAAYRTGSLLASALAQTGDVRMAYARSRPGYNTDYLYLASTDFLARTA
jgi:alkanesulfonate monooxygenase SsuD/methylene tetrahydromethanopterin reductase-like flavin-dependent oxidoreductase (luciferase family)